MKELCLVTTTGETTGINMHSLDSFRGRLRGDLLRANDPGYDKARRVWNALVDRRPGLVARCKGPSDVAAAIQFGCEHELLVSIKGGGHNIAGTAVCEGGLMLDLSAMTAIRVDAAARSARAEAGALGGDFDRETQAFGLSAPVGTVSTTGIAGLTLGGGQSWLTSKHGFAIDNLLSVDIVTADGVLRTANSTQFEDLFWAIRGAGHNFGAVTSFEYRLHPVGPVLGGLIVHPLSDAVKVLQFYRDFTSEQPDDLQTWAGILSAPDGTKVVVLIPCYAGPLDNGERLLAPLQGFGTPLADTIAPISYVSMQSAFDFVFPPDRLDYWKTGLTRSIGDDLILAAVEYAAQAPSPHSGILFKEFHGAYSRVGRTDTAYYHRDKQYELIALSVWENPEDTERNVVWTRELFAKWGPHLADAAYVNDLGDEGEERVRYAYGDNYPRLMALKDKYDPTNFFRLNQNIRPGAGAATGHGTR
jgi:FAD/FMN-containing dehydrogenase